MPLPYPDAYYYELPSESIDYTSIPTGRLAAEKLGKTAKFWKKSAKVYKKKSLVITDWTAEQWATEEAEQQFNHYLKLLEDGFELYVYLNYPIQNPNRSETLLKITDKDELEAVLKNESVRKLITPITQNKINQLMQPYGIPASQILCVPHRKAVEMSDFLRSSYNPQLLADYIKSENLAINYDTIDLYLKLAYKDRHDFLMSLENLSKTENWKKFIIPPVSGDASIAYHEHLKKMLLLPEATQNRQTLEFIQAEDINLNAHPYIKDLLKSPKLTALSLRNSDNIDLKSLFGDSSDFISHIEVLDLLHTSIEPEVFLKLISSNIVYLNIKLCTNLFELDPDALSEFNLNKLTHLEVDNNNSSELIIYFLNHAKNLTSLSIEWWNLPNPELVNNLDNLKKLDVKNVLELKPLLEKANNIESLKLEYIFPGNLLKALNSIPISIRQQLTNLKLTVKAGSLHDNQAEILDFIKNCPKLNSKNRSQLIAACSGPSKKTEPTSLKLENLEPASLDSNSNLDFSTTPNPKPKPSKPLSHNPNYEETIKNDTTKRTKEFNVRQFFWGLGGIPDPHPSHYRLNVTHELNITDNPKTPFKLTKKGDLRLIPVPCEWIDFDTYHLPIAHTQANYYSKVDVIVGAEWVALPSMSTQDNITKLHLTSDILSKTDMEIQYSLRDDLYYVRNKNPNTNTKNTAVTIDFRLTSPKIDRNGENCLKPIRELVKKYQAYDEKPGTLNVPPNATGLEQLRALQTQKPGVGACRHRVVAFKEEVERLYPDTKVRIPINDCHSFTEVQSENGEWECCDLGGYSGATLNLDSHNAPMPLQQEPKILELNSYDSLIDIESSSFNTWKVSKGTEERIPEFILNILNGKYSDKKTLVQLETQSMVNDFQLLLQDMAIKTQRPVFYVDSPDALSCALPWIELNEQTQEGRLKKGPGGELYRFLENYKNHKPPPILMINWDNFTPQEIVQFNSILDKVRMVDDVLIPEDLHIISLQVPKRKGAYNRRDFLSRFFKTIACQFNEAEIKKLAENLTKIPENPKNKKNTNITDLTDISDKTNKPINLNPVVIDLYQSAEWDSLLNGRWDLKGEQLKFKEGQLKTKLQEARSQNRPIEIKNGPWDNEEFIHFIQQARLPNRKIGPDINIQTSQGYAWDNLLSQTKFSNSDPLDSAFILNGNTLPYFFETYAVNNDTKTFHTKPGWFEQNTGQLMSIYVTRDLSVHQWARFLETAKQYNITLHIQIAPGVNLPAGFNNPISARLPIESSQSKVYLTQDIDYTVDYLKQENKNIKVFDISECNTSDLMIFIDAKLNEIDPDHPRYEFIQKMNALLTALKAGENVILKGKFKSDLVDELASLCLPKPYFCLNGIQEKNEMGQWGKCIFVTSPDNKNEFNFTPVVHHNVPEIYKQKTFIQTQTEARYLKKYPKGNIQDNYAGLKNIVTESKIEPDIQSRPSDQLEIKLGLETKFESETKIGLSLEACEAFEKERLNQVTEVLSDEPFIFIAGKTGVGKSSFVKRVLEKDEENYKLYHGLDAMEDWALEGPNQSDKTQKANQLDNNKNNNKTKILFIDEANIDLGDFSAFEGLYDNTPPGMLINGKYYTLTDKHKVMFAGNPVSDGNRELPLFLKNHGNSRIFKPLTTDYLYHRVLKPVLADYSLDKQEAISINILKIYQKICRYSDNKILISPRELQMMAVLIASDASENPNYYLYNIAKHCVPLNHINEFDIWFNQRFGSPIASFETAPLPVFTHPGAQFVLTESRRPVYQLMMDYLKLRDFKQNTPNEEARYAGLGGIIIEGDPGIGKSQIVIDVLIHNGFKKAQVLDLAPQTGKVFYELKANFPYTQKKALLLKAFNEGAVVLMDEMNTDPRLEKLLNDLLMGYGPDKKRPVKPGFMVICTQNPITMEGRFAESIAVDRRFSKLYLQEYPEIEMIEILTKKGLDELRATQLVKEYRAVYNYGLNNGKEPLPTFRLLQDTVEHYLEAERKHQAHPNVSHSSELLDSPNLPKQEQASNIKTSESDADSNLSIETMLSPSFKDFIVHIRDTNPVETKSTPPKPENNPADTPAQNPASPKKKK